MPNYEYHCSKCNHTLEVLQKMSDAPLTTCPACKQNTLKRGPGGGIGLHFKGTGFYKTDYESPNTSSGDTPSSPKKGCCPCKKNSGCH